MTLRVAVIAPPYPLEECPAPPLGITYVAAAFEAAGAQVRIFDYIVSRYTPEKLGQALDAFRPHVVGTTSVTLNYHRSARILADAKRHDDKILTIMGGPHVSFDWEATLRDYPGIDLIAIGEGEETIADLVMRLNQGERDWGSVAGLALRKDGQAVLTPSRPLIEDLDTLPLPARHLLPLSRYQALGYPVSMITSRGCPYACIFCLGRRMVGGKVRYRSAGRVVEEIEHILSYGLDRINVADDLFVSHRGKVREVCEEIRKRKLKFSWSAFARVNTVDRETLEMMRDAGCDSVSFGVESGNQEMLERIRKGITLDMARRAVTLCREVGILPHTSFLVGLPGETPQTLAETKSFARSLGSVYGYHILAPFPGSTVHDEVDRYDLQIFNRDWNGYDANRAVARTANLTADAINAFVDDYDREVQSVWEDMVAGHHGGTNAPDVDLKVEGHYRTQLVYRLLSEDLVEKVGTFPGGDLAAGTDAADLLCRSIHRATVMDEGLVNRTLRSLIAAGYIKVRREGGLTRWFWTHNTHREDA